MNEYTISKRRVVITGMGVISPVGLTVSEMWESLIDGRSGIRPISLFDVDGFDVRIAGEAYGFSPEKFMTSKDARRSDRFVQFSIAALEQALSQSNLEVNEANADQIGSIVGSGLGGIWTYTDALDDFRNNGPRRVSPFLIPSITIDIPAVHIALRTGASGPNFGVGSACATSAVGIGEAYETIRRGHASAMFAGGFEAAVTPIGIAAFDRMRALSHQNDRPEAASRPFDLNRDGFVIAEGGALLVLEELEFALSHGAEPLAEIVGYAVTSDAAHLTAPDPLGENSALCMTLAIERAELSTSDIDYINAHGTSTPAGDLAETQAIKRTFGVHAYNVPISSTKSMTGHLLGGAGALETAICVQVIQNGIIPPTINLEFPDPQCDLDFVPWVAREANVKFVLSNSFGFGGHNVSLVFKAF